MIYQCFSAAQIGFDSRHPLQYVENPVVIETAGFSLFINGLHRFCIIHFSAIHYIFQRKNTLFNVQFYDKIYDNLFHAFFSTLIAFFIAMCSDSPPASLSMSSSCSIARSAPSPRLYPLRLYPASREVKRPMLSRPLR